MLSRVWADAFVAARGARIPPLIRTVSSFKSAISLESLHPGSSLKLSTPSFTPEPNVKFSGYIPLQRLQVTYSASSGPGGQNTNKVHTKVDLRFQLSQADWLHPDIREKLAEQFKNRLTKEGKLVFKSELTRSQHLNLADCLHKLRQVIWRAAQTQPAPSPDTEERIRRRYEKAARERLLVKRMDSQKRAERRPPGVLDL